MKVYFVVKEPSERTINHFVSSLGKALQKQGCEVVYGLERLWMDEVLECDIVHFQWPEGIFGLFGHQVTDEELTRVNQRLAWLKENGKRIFYTCHNLKPHTNRALGVLRLYDIIYSHADTIVHLGQYSCELLQPQYPNAHHIVIPHHIYDNMLPFSFSQQEARQRLHLPQGRKIILSFGKFRNDQERNFVLNVKKQIEALSLKAEANSKLYTLNSTLFLMPGFYRETLHTLNPKKFITRLYHTLCYKLKGIQFSNDVIPDDLMQCYFCAADVVLIQRLDILNSGNLPMAFAAGKVVVGPNAGNVGEILRDTGNFTFDSEYTESAISALQSALNATSKGKDNKTYAAKHWSSDIIATKLLRCYQKTITTNLIIDRNKNIYEMTDKVFNTGETQSELTAKYNPEGSILRRAQMRMLDMLLYFDIVCKEQNIPYRIDGGNVLGAVRHGGFIPWDDDIDVVIMRKDLHRLCDYLIKNPHPQYKLQTFNTDYGYVGAWVVLRDTKSEYFQDSVVHNARKYRGLQIDIFPYENRVIKTLHRFSAKITKYNGKWFVGKHMRVARIIFVLQHRILHPIFRAIGRLFGAPDIYMYPYGARIFRSHTSKSQFPYKDISFEGHLFPGPADPDLFCKEFYGEKYMELPDISNRNHHKATYRIED